MKNFFSLCYILFLDKQKYEYSPERPFYFLSKSGIDRVRAYLWSNIKDYDNYRSFGGATRLGRMWRKIAFPPQMRPGYDFFDFTMNQNHINFIAKLRSNGRLCTDRALSEHFSKTFPNTGIVCGDQYDGHWLGRYASDLTGDVSLSN